MVKKLLFIEDEEDFAKVIASYLRKKGFAIVHASSGQQGLRELQKNSYDLVILDLVLPDEEGLKICEKIREKETIPVLILTARNWLEDKVAGLNLGADDYLVKPVSLRELIVRIERLLNRDLKTKFRSSVFQFGGLKLDIVTGKLTLKGKSVMLTKKERAVLEYLLLKKGQVLTRMEIMDHVWGDDIDLLSNMPNMVISSLRRKLERLSGRNFIQSVYGLGYKFEIEGLNSREKKHD